MRKRPLLLLCLLVLAACAGGNSYEKRTAAGVPETPAALSGARRLPEGTHIAPPLRAAQGAWSGVVGQAPGIRLVGATFVDGSSVPPHQSLRVRVLSLSLVLEQARVGLPQRYRQAMGVVGAGRVLPLAAAVELTEAELLALAQIGRLSPVALQLHLAMRVDGAGSGTPRTPAQRARAQGLSGTNSVGGQVPPGSGRRSDGTPRGTPTS